MIGCTEKLIQNNGLLSVDIPNDISGGYYLVRPELLALHQADKSPPNPQFYVGCAQIFLLSAGTGVPKDTVSIPGYVHTGDASVDFNIYTPKWPYPMPGPAPYEGGSSIKDNAKAVGSSEVQKEGLVPNGCVLSNANCKSPLKYLHLIPPSMLSLLTVVPQGVVWNWTLIVLKRDVGT
jgi:hypothetical protein